MNLTDKYKKIYLPGFDCRLSTFRNSLAINDNIFTNSMILGLSGGLIFCFNDGHFLSRVPCFIVSGISDQTIEHLSSTLNLYVFRGRMLSMKNAIEQIPDYLSKEIPVNIAVNRHALFEVIGHNNEAEGFEVNMGFHYITLTHLDTYKDEFTLFETNSSKPIVINKSQLEYIWFYDILHERKNIDPFQLCDGQWYGILCKNNTKNEIITSAYSGIQKVLTNFFNSPVEEVVGIKALVNFQTQMHIWKSKINDKKYFCDSIYFMSVMEFGLSGGGFGRKLFSYFLNELSTLIADLQLKEISLQFTDLSKKWNKLVQQLQQCIINYDDCHINMDLLKLVIEGELDTVVNTELNCMILLNGWMNNKIKI